MIKEKLPPIGPVISGDLDGYNAHTHIPGYTGFFPGRKCKEYLLLKRADPDTNAQLEDLCMRYSTKVCLDSLQTHILPYCRLDASSAISAHIPRC